jgi:hypothetical protein
MTPEEQEQQRKTAALNASSGFSQQATKAPATSAAALPPPPTALTPAQATTVSQQAQALNASAGRLHDAQTAAAQPNATPDQKKEALDLGGARADNAFNATTAVSANPQTSSTANFGFTPQQGAQRQAADTAVQAAKDYKQQVIDAAGPGGVPDPALLARADTAIASATRGQDVADINAQSENGGVQRVDQQGVMPGIGGLFGMTRDQSNFTAGPVSTSALDATAGRADALGASIAGRQNVQATGATIDTTKADQGRVAATATGARQSGLADILTASAMGNGPSAAQMQLQRATDSNTAKAAALAASGRGVNPALMARQAAEGAASANQDAAGQSAILRSQEQQQAQQALGGVLTSERGQDLQSQSQDLGAATAQAGLDETTNTTNAALTVDQQKEKDTMQAQLLQQVQTGQITQIQAQQQMAQFNADLQARQESARNGQSISQGNQQTAAIGQGIATAGAIAATAMSDKRAKKNIDDGEEETRAFLKVLRPKGFDYKDPANGEGRHIGVMAQDVERGAPGIVVEEGGFKKLDIRKALSASLASLGSIDKRLSRMESKRG